MKSQHTSVSRSVCRAKEYCIFSSIYLNIKPLSYQSDRPSYAMITLHMSINSSPFGVTKMRAARRRREASLYGKTNQASGISQTTARREGTETRIEKKKETSEEYEIFPGGAAGRPKKTGGYNAPQFLFGPRVARFVGPQTLFLFGWPLRILRGMNEPGLRHH